MTFKFIFKGGAVTNNRGIKADEVNHVQYKILGWVPLTGRVEFLS